MEAKLDKKFPLEAKLDGFRMYKIHSRGDMINGRKVIAPIYVCGLPGDVKLLNDELALMDTEFTHLVKLDGRGILDGEGRDN